MGLNPVTGNLDGSGVKATHVCLRHPDWCFLDASNDCCWEVKKGVRIKAMRNLEIYAITCYV